MNHALQTALPTYPHGADSVYAQRYSRKLYKRGVTTAVPGSFKVIWSIDHSSAFYGGSSLKLTSDPLNLSPYQEAIYPSSTEPESSEWSSYSGRSSSSSLYTPSSSPSGSALRSSVSSQSSKTDRLLRRMPSSSQIQPRRVQVVPLFLLDFAMEPLEPFNFFVSFLKNAKGDVFIRISGRWIVDTPSTPDNLATCYDELDSDSTVNVYGENVFEADLSGSVLNSWVRKSFNFKTPQIPQEMIEKISIQGKAALMSIRFVINHLDIVCADNFSGTIRLGSLLLYSGNSSENDRSVKNDSSREEKLVVQFGSFELASSSSHTSTPSIKAPARVANVNLDLHGPEKARILRWENDTASSEWIVYINDRMTGVASAAGWVISETLLESSRREVETSVNISELEVITLTVRIDAVGCGGAIVKGVEQILSV